MTKWRIRDDRRMVLRAHWPHRLYTYVYVSNQRSSELRCSYIGASYYYTIPRQIIEIIVCDYCTTHRKECKSFKSFSNLGDTRTRYYTQFEYYRSECFTLTLMSVPRLPVDEGPRQIWFVSYSREHLRVAWSSRINRINEYLSCCIRRIGRKIVFVLTKLQLDVRCWHATTATVALKSP